MTSLRSHYLLWATALATLTLGCQGPTGDASKLPAPAPCKPKVDAPAKPVVAKPTRPVDNKAVKPAPAPARPTAARPTATTAAKTALFDGSHYGFQIRYPAEWTVRSWKRLDVFHVVFMAPESESPGFIDSINVLSRYHPGVTLKQWLKAQDYTIRYSKTQQQFKPFNSKPGTVGGLPGNIREISSLVNKRPVRFKQHTVFTKTRAIQITYTADKKRYKAGLPRYHAIAATLRIL